MRCGIAEIWLGKVKQLVKSLLSASFSFLFVVLTLFEIVVMNLMVSKDDINKHD